MPKSSVTNSILFRRANIQKLTRVAKEPHITFGKSAVGRSVKRFMKGEARKFVEHIKKPPLKAMDPRVEKQTIGEQIKELWRKEFLLEMGKSKKERIRADVDLVMQYGPGAIGGVTRILQRMGILKGVQKPVKFTGPPIKGTPDELAKEIVKRGGKVNKVEQIAGWYDPKTNQVGVISAKQGREFLGDAREVGMHESLHAYIRRELKIARGWGRGIGPGLPRKPAKQNVEDLFRAGGGAGWTLNPLPLGVEESVVRNLTRKMLKQPRKKRKLK
jgi:hypothetical protein